jgi:hypothetical protein
MIRMCISAVLALAVLVSGAQGAKAQGDSICPDPIAMNLTEREIEAEVEAGFLSRLISSLGLGGRYSEKKRAVFENRPMANQDIMIFMMFRTECLLIVQAKDLSTERKLELIAAARDAYYRRVFSPEVYSTAQPTGDESRFEGAQVIFVANEASEGSTYLQDPPYYVTDANKYFVIVASARTFNEARAAADEFKRKAPQFDFVVYEPYGDNPWYGVMMATWVSREVAREALQDARRLIAEDSYIWACRGSGEVC